MKRCLLILMLLAAGAGAHDGETGEIPVTRLVLPEDFAVPTALHVSPDTVAFGGQAIVAVDFPTGTVLPAVADLIFAPGLVGLQPADKVLVPKETFPEAEGPRLLLSIRAYALGPVQVAAGDLLSAPLIILGKVQDPAETAPVRGPRVWGMPLFLPVAIGLALLLLAALVWWLWRRRGRLDPLAQWDVAQPAWLNAAVALEALLKSGRLDRGETRLFLDDLAAILRHFLTDRYRVPATGATGVDLQRACVRLGHAPDHPRTFARLMDAVDSLRYGPEAASDGDCRAAAGEFLLAVDAVRIVPRYTPVPPRRLLTAEQAWSRLQGIPWLGAVPAAAGSEEA